MDDPSPKNTRLTLQQWGNSLAMRIPAAIARSVKLTVGQPVELSVQDESVIVTPVGQRRLSLAQKLADFDPAIHGGESMRTGSVGKEVF